MSKQERWTPFGTLWVADESAPKPDPVCCHFCKAQIYDPKECMAAWWENDDYEVFDAGAYCRHCLKRAEEHGHLRDIHGNWAGWSAVWRVFFDYEKWHGKAARDFVLMCTLLEEMMEKKEAGE